MADKVELVKVQKGEAVIEVHPTALESHRVAGWSPAAADAKVTPIEEVPGFVEVEEPEKAEKKAK